MRYRSVGSSSLKVSEIALGTGDNAGAMVYGSAKQQLALVAGALEAGVNLFDTSPDYGKGLGEANLGRTLKELGARDALIVTKVEIMPEDLGRIGARVRESVNDSLLRLQRDHVDIVMLHNPVRAQRDLTIRQWSRITPADVLDEVLPAMMSVRAAGKARYLGLACEASDPQSVRKLLASGEFPVINAWYNLANPSASTSVTGLPPGEDYTGLFATARELGAGVIVIRPLAGGALTGAMQTKSHAGRHELSRGYYRDQPHMFEPELARARHFAFLERPPQQALADAATKFILGEPAVCSIVGGFSELSHLAAAVKCSEDRALDPADLDRIQAVFRRGF
ncbi:MAG: aldo/keto reductase [Burkholderiales bacterium]